MCTRSGCNLSMELLTENETISTLRSSNVRKLTVLLIGLLAIGLTAIDPMGATWYLTDGNAVATVGMAGGTATIGGATVGGVATAGANIGTVLATGGGALVVMGVVAA